jgi:GntR family transcriptional repressor for pyruvate dehydrogenase complex
MDNIEVNSLREPKMADRVASNLRRMLARGEIAEGTILPPESELMQRFGVSRPTLREAFRVLESESLIKVERGVRGGARVHRPQRETLARYAGLILQYEGVPLRDVYDARVAIETPMVVQLANDQNADELTAFHAAIARLSPNKTLQVVSEMLHHIIEKGNRSLQPTSGTRSQQAVRRSVKTHRMILALIKSGDAENAAELWSRHLQKAEDYLFTGSELATVVDLLA